VNKTFKNFVAGMVAGVSLIVLTGYVGNILPVNRGGTGSATKNFVDLTTAQSKAGLLTLTGGLKLDAAGETVNKIWTTTVNVDTGSISTATFARESITVPGVLATDKIISWKTNNTANQYHAVNAYVPADNTVVLVIGNLNNDFVNNPEPINYTFTFLRF
jgi:hypothetical protein